MLQKQMPKTKMACWQNTARASFPAAGDGNCFRSGHFLNFNGVLPLVLACYCGSTRMCRRTGKCVDPNQTDFLGAC